MCLIFVFLFVVRVALARTLGENCLSWRSMQGACESFLDERDGKWKEYACVNLDGFIRCVLPKLRGEVCSSYHGWRECDYGLECTSVGRCFAASTLGEPCNMNSAVSDHVEVCGSNLLCLGGTCTNLFSASPIPPVEEQCSGDRKYGFRSCRGDLTCVTNRGYCKERAKIGEQCDSIVDCVMDAQCKSFVCAPLAKEDEDCITDQECEGNLKCNAVRFLCEKRASMELVVPSAQSAPTPVWEQGPTPATTPTMQNNNSNFAVPWKIVGIVIGVLAFVAVLVAFGCCSQQKSGSEVRVFLSHTGQDVCAKDFTGHLHAALSKQPQLSAFYDCETLADQGGAYFERVIDESVGQCDLFVCIFSHTYPFRYWCMRELAQATLLDKPILPILVEQVSPKDSTRSSDFEDKFTSAHLKKVKNMAIIQEWIQHLNKLSGRQCIRCQTDQKNSQAKLVEESTRQIVAFAKRGKRLPNS